MPRVEIKQVNGDLTFQKEVEQEKILDIKRYIYEQISKTSEDTTLDMAATEERIEKGAEKIILIYEGRTVADEVYMKDLVSGGAVSQLQFILKTPEFSGNLPTQKVAILPMDAGATKDKVKITLNGDISEVSTADVVNHNGKLYLVKERRRRRDLLGMFNSIRGRVCRNMLIKVLVIIYLTLNNNFRLACLLLSIMFMRFLSNVEFRIKMRSDNFVDSAIKTVCAFFSTVFLMNYERHLDFSNKI